MELGSSLSGSEHRPWERLMKAFLALLDGDDASAKAGDVCDLFLGDPWFQQLVERRARRAVDVGAIPLDWRPDLEQHISLLFVQKVRRRPDLGVDRQMAEEHFGGFVWTIVERLALNAIERLHKLYRRQSALFADVAGSARWTLEQQVDVGLLLAGLPPLTRTILTLYDAGHTLKQIADLVGEEYWRVCKIYRDAIATLEERLTD